IFDPPVSFAFPSTYMLRGEIISDIDDDGKVDLLTINLVNQQRMFFYKNISQVGPLNSTSFGQSLQLDPISAKYRDLTTQLIKVVDFNGDGKQDIVNSRGIYLNNSNGVITSSSFNKKINIAERHLIMNVLDI